MILRLAGMVCDGSAAVNEDAAGFVGSPEDVQAAWVLDGVTGINQTHIHDGGSDAAWFVNQVETALRRLVMEPVPLPVIMSALISDLVKAGDHPVPEDYDPPACCLVLVRRFGDRWDAVRLGDSSLLVAERGGQFFQYTEFPLQWLDRELKVRTATKRSEGRTQAELIEEFRPMILQSRQMRNRPGGYGILEAAARCLDFVQYIAVEDPQSILLCTDGFFRLVDTYNVYDEAGLVAETARTGPGALLSKLRAIEAGDADCVRYPRFKPRDDAAAICLISGKSP